MAASSAPFPMGPAALSRMGHVQLVPERNEYVPVGIGFTAHTNAGLVVKQNGEPIAPGFTVAEMLPERRWAVKEDGEILPQLEFTELYLRKLEQWFLYASPEAQQGAPRRAPSSFNSRNEPVPNVREYVSMRADPRDPRKILPMGYDPDATKGTRIKRLWDSENERFIEGSERMALLVEAFRIEQSGGDRRLTPSEREEVEKHLAGMGSAGMQPVNATQARLETYSEMLRDGELTKEQYAEKVAALFGGSDLRPPKHKAASKRGHRLMPCGTEVPNPVQRRHVDECSVCTEADLKRP